MDVVLALSSYKKGLLTSVFSLFICSTVHAASLSTEVYSTNGTSIGTIHFEDGQFGLLIKPQLKDLPVGLHGFHIHQHADCGDKGMKAGGHLDPANTNSHQGPYGAGHLGDLPILAVNANGEANIPTLAPRLKTENLHGHSVMIHAGGDNYSDNPPLGGGGARIGCGKIP